MDNKKTVDLIYPLIKDLVEKDYRDLEAHNHLGRFTEKELERAIKEYGGEVTLPKKEEIRDIFIYPCGDKEYIIELYLWIDFKKSDLTLSIHLKKKSDGQFTVSIEDLRVL